VIRERIAWLLARALWRLLRPATALVLAVAAAPVTLVAHQVVIGTTGTGKTTGGLFRTLVAGGRIMPRTGTGGACRPSDRAGAA
jgi:hypothetical protein